MEKLLTVGHTVELPEMLAGREKRAARQREIISKYGGVLVCMTLNVAGPVKVNALTDAAFYAAYEEIEKALSGVAFTRISHHYYGNEAYFAMPGGDISDIKRRMLEIEESHPLGRLFDIDVLEERDGEIHKISRTDVGAHERTCLICGGDAKACASTRAHGLDKILSATYGMIYEYIKERGLFAGLAGGLAVSALLSEVYTTPKPGLVDLDNDGSHPDMTMRLFEKSAAALRNYFADCFKAGEETREIPTYEVLSRIRPLGIEAEKTMYESTSGVNTHKGIIFSLGIILTAAGRVGVADTDVTLLTAGEIACPALADFNGEASTKGEEQYAAYGLQGIRGEAAAGFPSVRNIALPAFDEATSAGLSWNDAGVFALLRLVSGVQDSNMIARGGRDLAQEMAIMAGHLAGAWQLATRVDSNPAALLAGARKLDEMFMRKNLSPGGCADLLAITYFIKMLQSV